MYFYIKAVRPDESDRIQDDFEKVFADRGSPEDKFLAQARHEEPGYDYLIWISSNEDIRALYLDFRPVAVESLPREARLLVGHPKTFEQYFTYDTRPA